MWFRRLLHTYRMIIISNYHYYRLQDFIFGISHKINLIYLKKKIECPITAELILFVTIVKINIRLVNIKRYRVTINLPWPLKGSLKSPCRVSTIDILD